MIVSNAAFNVENLRSLFPTLDDESNATIYFDNASTTLKPWCVIKKMNEAYSEYPMNVHRGSYRLSERASGEYEKAREYIRAFINAASKNEIIITKGTTESVNLISYSFGEKFIKKGDEIILTEMEHHANIVPWKMLCNRTGAILKVIPLTPEGDLNLDVYRSLLSKKTKLVSVIYVSNSLGTINPIETIIAEAHLVGAKVLVDAAQAVAHFPIDVQKLDVDFLCFSGHKMFGPFGVGILYGKESLLEEMPPFLGGGGMIQSVSFESITYQPLPNKFEPGTPAIASLIGLGEAVNFIKGIGFENIKKQEELLTSYSKKILENIPGLRIFGNGEKRCGVFSFNITGIHPHDVNTFLDSKGVAIRSGHHCNQPIMQYFKVPATNRISLSFYNTKNEIDYVSEVLQQTRRFFL